MVGNEAPGIGHGSSTRSDALRPGPRAGQSSPAAIRARSSLWGSSLLPGVFEQDAPDLGDGVRVILRAGVGRVNDLLRDDVFDVGALVRDHPVTWHSASANTSAPLM